MTERPNTGAVDSSVLWRINSTAQKVSVVFDAARHEARDECLWLASTCRALLADNDRLRLEVEGLRKALADVRPARGEPSEPSV